MNYMANKPIKFHRKYIIKYSGRSAKWPEDKMTYQEKGLDMYLRALINQIKMYYPNSELIIEDITEN